MGFLALVTNATVLLIAFSIGSLKALCVYASRGAVPDIDGSALPPFG